MKAIVRKVLEAGLVEKHMAIMLEKWGQLDEGAHNLIGKEKITKETLHKFAEEIDGLMEKENGQFRETVLQETIIRANMQFRVDGFSGVYTAAVDSLGRFIFPIDAPIHRGSRLISIDERNLQHVVQEVDPIYLGDQIVSNRVTVL